jgi:hypothetical protein
VSIIWARNTWLRISFISLHNLSSNIALINITFSETPREVIRIAGFSTLLTKLLDVVHLRFKVAQLMMQVLFIHYLTHVICWIWFLVFSAIPAPWCTPDDFAKLALSIFNWYQSMIAILNLTDGKMREIFPEHIWIILALSNIAQLSCRIDIIILVALQTHWISILIYWVNQTIFGNEEFAVHTQKYGQRNYNMAWGYRNGSTFVINVLDWQLVHLLESYTNVWLDILYGIIEDRNSPCC